MRNFIHIAVKKSTLKYPSKVVATGGAAKVYFPTHYKRESPSWERCAGFPHWMMWTLVMLQLRIRLLCLEQGGVWFRSHLERYPQFVPSQDFQRHHFPPLILPMLQHCQARKERGLAHTSIQQVCWMTDLGQDSLLISPVSQESKTVLQGWEKNSRTFYIQASII